MMTKTQLELIKEGQSSRIGRVAIETGFYTGRRNTSPFGGRRREAMHKLRDDGYFTFESHDKGVHHFSGNWAQCHHTTSCWRITEKGKAVVI